MSRSLRKITPVNYKHLNYIATTADQFSFQNMADQDVLELTPQDEEVEEMLDFLDEEDNEKKMNEAAACPKPLVFTPSKSKSPMPLGTGDCDSEEEMTLRIKLLEQKRLR